MPWKYLDATTLSSKPNVLAGPILRKVDETSVTVWFALRRKATVKLTVVDKDGIRLFDGTRTTTAVGSHLHIVAVTARAKVGEPNLKPGNVYMYNASFTYPTGNITNPVEVDASIAAATKGAPLTYAPHALPSFCLPPGDIFSLRILHGSCRRPDGEGLDVLAIADTLISQKADRPLERPHQLLLTGDQIYADDVAPSLLMMLTDAATFLMGRDEVLPPPKEGRGSIMGQPATAYPPFSRRALLKAAKFSSVDLSNHVLSLGEYLCMYLFAWSDVLWPPANEVPDVDDVWEAALPHLEPDVPAGIPPRRIRPDIAGQIRAGIAAAIKRLANGRATLSNVRRALANVPTYMIFDDHEVTDDWNMTEDVAADFYGSPLGYRVAQNALVAYALCQHWGNRPEEFLETDSTRPGTRLLGLVQKLDALQATSTEICTIVGVPTAQEVRANHRVAHAAGALRYDYVIEGGAHQILVTDTRTWRAYTKAPHLAAEMLPPSQMAAQIANAGKPLAGRQLIVVLSTNAPPTLGIRKATEMRRTAETFEHFPDIHEAWDIPTVAFDRLMTALSEKVGFSAGPSQKVVLLSGDVHHGFATRLHYKAINRFEQTTARHANIVIAQAVASGYHRQDEKTLGLQRDGFDYAPHVTKALVPDAETEYYLGWNLQPAGQTVMLWNRAFLRLRGASSLRLELPPHVLLGGDTHVFIPPDFSYQLDYITMTGGGVPKVLVPLPVVPPGQTPGELTKEESKTRAQLLAIATDNYRTHNKDDGVVREIIGVNNMGELTFSIPPAPATGPFKANHRLWFRTPDGQQAFADIAINMESDDPDHPLPAGFPEVQP